MMSPFTGKHRNAYQHSQSRLCKRIICTELRCESTTTSSTPAPPSLPYPTPTARHCCLPQLCPPLPMHAPFARDYTSAGTASTSALILWSRARPPAWIAGRLEAVLKSPHRGKLSEIGERTGQLHSRSPQIAVSRGGVWEGSTCE